MFLLPCCFDWVQFVLGSAEEKCLEKTCSISCIQDFPGQESPVSIREDARSASCWTYSPLFGKNCASMCQVSYSKALAQGTLSVCWLFHQLSLCQWLSYFRGGDQRGCGVAALTLSCILRFPWPLWLILESEMIRGRVETQKDKTCLPFYWISPPPFFLIH